MGETFKDAILPNHEEYTDFLSRLASSGRPTRELVANVIGLAVGSSVNYAQSVAQVVDFYLSDERTKEREQVIALAKRPEGDKEAEELMKGYVREAMRLNPQFGGLFRAVVQDGTVPQGDGFEPLRVKAGDLLFASFKNAHLNVSRVCLDYVLITTNEFSLLAEGLPEPDVCRPDAQEG